MQVYFSFRSTLLVFLLMCVVMSYSYAHGLIQVPAVEIDVNSFPLIEEDVQALSYFSAHAKNAAERLIERGVEVLAQAHGVLSDPSAPLPQKLQLILVLSEIGDADSTDIIIAAANEIPNNIDLQEYALVALQKFEPETEIKAFVNQHLENATRHPVILRNALGYYVNQPDNTAKQWVDKYAAAGASSEVRFAALYLGGALGMDSVKNDIAELLQSKQQNTREYYLLMGFAHVATMEEFNALIKDKNLNKDNIKKVREFLTFRLANTQEKKNLAPGLLNSDNTQLKQAAVKQLIEEKDADTLVINWRQGDGYVRAAVKRAGFTINEDEHGASFEVVENNKSSFLWIFVFTLSILLGGFLLWRFKHSDMQQSS